MASASVTRITSAKLICRDNDDGDNAMVGRMPRTRSAEGSVFLRRRHSAPSRELDAVDTYFRRWHSDPGYVSLKEIINSPEFREGSTRPPEAGICDPLVRQLSRVYLSIKPCNCHMLPGKCGLHHPRRSRLSRFMDGVLMMQFFKPCLRFIGSVFRRPPTAPEPPADCRCRY